MIRYEAEEVPRGSSSGRVYCESTPRQSEIANILLYTDSNIETIVVLICSNMQCLLFKSPVLKLSRIPRCLNRRITIALCLTQSVSLGQQRSKWKDFHTFHKGRSLLRR